ncbi:sigma-54-dependent Fis family transcriptional regulator [Buttiauxella warmboldiae]|uniref:Sigma-54-dependent Fis family transcriptional regulator n=1 Tax=Buttiauxella warmboldiae TaxID=82993 RepID=A0A3N5DLI1_9ENTR|nr:sigma-54 dependent transcriptional regulator [Buttiauxella warmboldiae]RPH29468.1 sigma-54-dependent Fis family transcriptional regulator [Buttiauxella warmboldiae]
MNGFTQDSIANSHSFIAHAAASVNAFNLAKRVAEFNVATIITGETGTGKECIARTIHHYSVGQNAPYVAVNCAAIPETMLESILFGHVKGAFTGALSSMPGKFELANNGVLLLDEIGDMPLNLQAKLLRVLQEQEVERLGSHKKIPLDIRVIASTNKDLLNEISEGRFRQDLYYRLAVVPIHVSPLRERPEDIIPLALSFIKKYQTRHQQNKKLSEDARFALLKYSWPGNIRELENVIQRGLILSSSEIIHAADLSLPVQHASASVHHQWSENRAAVAPVADAIRGVKVHGRLAEYQYIIDLLKQHNGNKSRTAQSLGITPRALRYRLATMRGDGIDMSCYA